MNSKNFSPVRVARNSRQELNLKLEITVSGMSTIVIGLLGFNCVLFVGFLYVMVRLHRRPKDNPRLSRGLQLLQSKIAVLEDLSDRVDKQANDLTSLTNTVFEKVKANER